MSDYIYLLKNRLSPHQRNALELVREAAREAGMTVFLAGGAVRDLTSGSPVNDLDVVVQGNALNLKTALEQAGATLWGEHPESRTLYVRFPVGVTVEISSARREEFPQPGKPVYYWDASVLEDLRRRDFTANAMALSLNEGSYGLLMDPLNGVADIEARQLRLVSNYGFLEDPSRLLRATRLAARLGWQLDERTQTRFQNAKDENVIESLAPYLRGYELEEIGHEEDGLKVLAAMEAEGWMHALFPAWTPAAADSAALEEMRTLVTQLQMQGVSPDISATSVHYLTAKLSPKDLSALKAAFVRPGFVKEWDNLDNLAKEFARQLTGKEAATPSATWKLFTSADPQAVLWLGLTSKSAPVKEKYKNFFTVWPEAKQKIPYALFQEMRITPEIPNYEQMISELFLGTIDGNLETDEQLRAFLEPYSPPAPPPPVTLRRTRASKKEAKAKATLEAELEGEPAEIEDDEAVDDVAMRSDDEDEGDGEDEEAPMPKKAAPKAARKSEGKAAVAEAKPAKAASAPAKTAAASSEAGHAGKGSNGSSHATTSPRSEKANLLQKPAKAAEKTAAGHSSAAHAPASHGHAPQKKGVPAKANGVKPPAHKAPAPVRVANGKAAAPKTAPAKPAAKPAKKPAVKAAKPAVAAKKAPAKAVAKSHKKAEPAKKSRPAHKAPARKHR